MNRTDARSTAAALALSLAAGSASATPTELELGEPGRLPPPPASAPEADRGGASPGDERGSRAAEPLDRAFAYVPDPRLPPSLSVIGSYAASYSSTEAAARPLAALSARSGLVSELGAELGLLDRLSVAGSVGLAPGSAGGNGDARAAGRAYLRGLVTEPRSRSFRLTLGAGYLRDFSPASGPFVQAAASLDLGRLRIGAMSHAEKMLASDRDEVDLYASAGASVKVIEQLRLGTEYVGQDFEDAWEEEEAEGGVRHFAGLTLAASPVNRMSIVIGPAFGLSENSPKLLGRVSLSYGF